MLSYTFIRFQISGVVIKRSANSYAKANNNVHFFILIKDETGIIRVKFVTKCAAAYKDDIKVHIQCVILYSRSVSVN